MKKCDFCVVILLIIFLIKDVGSCGPGRGAGRRRRPHTLTPLVLKQHIPNVSENTLGASGPPEKRGPIRRGDKRFKELVINWNPNIIFKDEEGTESDRMMTRRLREKLDILAVSVRNQWPDVKLRVTEAWDENNQHADDSLHYQGRAADITTSDRDTSKYGMLARLAVEAGFDWVYYESKGHVHCSVKSDDSAAIRNGGCFPAHSSVNTPNGRKLMSLLQIGDLVQVLTPEGELKFSKILLFLDRREQSSTIYFNIETGRGNGLSLTPSHLVFTTKTAETIADSTKPNPADMMTRFAGELKSGDAIYTLNKTSGHLEEDVVIRITQSTEMGIFAPLTAEGNVLVDGALASCYAVVNSHALAHVTLTPLRWLTSSIVSQTKTNRTVILAQEGRHWYADLLYRLAQYILPANLLFNT